MTIQEPRENTASFRERSGAAEWREPAARQRGAQALRKNGWSHERLATGLGWFSIGLGLAELAAPQRLARMIGVPADDGNRAALRAVGLREIANGLGILIQSRPTGWLWTRVAGDAMDLSLLGKALASDNVSKNRVAAATAAVVGVTVLDVVCGQQLSRDWHAMQGSDGSHAWATADGATEPKIERSITIGKPADQLYLSWRDPQILVQIMGHFAEVTAISGDRQHWKVSVPVGRVLEWDTRIVEERPGEFLRWASLAGAGLPNEGSVHFRPAPGDRGTEVTLHFRFDPPGGALGDAAARLLGVVPKLVAEKALRRFKSLAETGEIPTIRYQPAARSGSY